MKSLEIHLVGDNCSLSLWLFGVPFLSYLIDKVLDNLRGDKENSERGGDFIVE